MAAPTAPTWDEVAIYLMQQNNNIIHNSLPYPPNTSIDQMATLMIYYTSGRQGGELPSVAAAVPAGGETRQGSGPYDRVYHE